MTPPLVSCLMPTYNRFPDHAHLVEEAVESFLRQDYPNKELIILNDTPGQEIVYDNPLVKIWNMHSRIFSLGKKRNILCGLACGQICCPWDDDDISLPWRISQGVEKLRIQNETQQEAKYWNPRREWYMPKEGLISKHSHGVCHNASIFVRHAIYAIGGYENKVEASGSEDAIIDGKLAGFTEYCAPPLTDDPRDWSYIYRWGVSPCHVSSVRPHGDFYQRIGDRPIQTGRFVISPNWKTDYVELCRQHIERLK